MNATEDRLCDLLAEDIKEYMKINVMIRYYLFLAKEEAKRERYNPYRA